MKKICVQDDLVFKAVEGELAEMYEIYWVSDDKSEHVLGYAASNYGVKEIMEEASDKETHARKLKVLFMEGVYYLLQKMDLDNQNMLVKTNPANNKVITKEEIDYIISNIRQGPK